MKTWKRPTKDIKKLQELILSKYYNYRFICNYSYDFDWEPWFPIEVIQQQQQLNQIYNHGNTFYK
jgi:hypothetical protein